MDKKIIAVICASLIVISAVFASCGKKKPTINAKDATYEVVTDEEGNTVLNENGEIEIYVTNEDGKKVTDENGEIKTGAVPFPDKITDGVFHETKYFKMVYPNGWTVGNSGIATSKKYKGLDAQVMYSGAATDDSAAENEANNAVSQWNQILSQAGDAVTGVTVEQRTVTLEKCGATAYVVEVKKADDKNPKTYSVYQLTMDFVCNGGLYHVQCFTEDGNTFDGSLDLAAMYGANLTIK